MLYFTGKGDRAIQFVEVTDREPWFVEGLRYTGEQIKGSCLVPKRAMDVMQCEVSRVHYPDLTFYVDADPDPTLVITKLEIHKFYSDSHSQQCQFTFFSLSQLCHNFHFVQNIGIFLKKIYTGTDPDPAAGQISRSGIPMPICI